MEGRKTFGPLQQKLGRQTGSQADIGFNWVIEPSDLCSQQNVPTSYPVYVTDILVQ